MKLVNAQNRIKELMSRFVVQIEMAAAMSRTDLNKAAETVLIPLLNEVYGWSLKNINYSEDNPNYPGIDLGDEAAKISIQVTATHTLDKVKHTLEQFTKHNQYSKYNRLIIYILKKKQDSYSKTAIHRIIQNRFNFDSQKDIWDCRDIIKEVSNFQIDRALRVQGILEANFGKDQELTSPLSNRLEPRINWRETCRELLNHWKGLTTNILTRPNGVRFQLDDIFVPLGVVERREKPKHCSNDGFSAEQGSELYEEKVTPISQNDFFEQVLRQRQSKHSQGSRIAIIGEPGAGKTTQLQKIGDWILTETDDIPIWIPLTAVGTRKLKDYLLSDWLQTAIEELDVSQAHRDELGQLLKTGKVWLLLDGVDEMAIPDALYQIATQMCEGWLRNVRVVLTCRLNVWDAGENALDGFDVYRNLDFEYPNEVHQVIDKWFATEPALQQTLKVALEQPGKERIRDMVKNPLRLTLLCYSWQLRQGELPETKAGLYEWFVDEFYKWDKNKVPIKLSSTKRKELNHALGELAKAAIDQDSSRFRLREKFISRSLGDANDEDSFFYLALQIGWLNRVGVAAENALEDVYAFFHPTFQEYFAALAIDDWHFFLNHIPKNPNHPDASYRIFDPHWKEAFLVWLGRNDLSKDLKEACLNTLIEFNDNCENSNFYFHKAYFLVVSGTASFSQYSRADEVIQQTFFAAFGCLDVETNEWKSFLKPVSESAKTALCEANWEKVVSTLICNFPTDEVEGFLAISKLESKFNNNLDNIKFLIHLLKNQYLIIRYKAAHNLIRIGVKNQFLIRGLCRILETNEDIAFNSLIAWTLGKVNPEDACAISRLTELIELCQDDNNYLDVVEKLIDISPGNSNAVEKLIKFISLETDWDIFRRVRDILTKTIFSSSILISLIDKMTAVIEERNHRIQNGMYKHLGTSREQIECIEKAIHDNNSVGELVDLLIQGEGKAFEVFIDGEIVRRLIEITLKIGDSESLKAILKSNRYSKIHSKVIRILEVTSLLDLELTHILVNFLRNSQDQVVCAQAMKALKRISQVELLSVIVVNLNNFLILERFDNAFYRYRVYYEVLWHCAQNMSYPDFYRAWHNSSSASAELLTDD